MCYNVTSGTKAALKYAKHRGDDPTLIAELERQLEIEIKHLTAYHQVSGFAHPKLLAFTCDTPNKPQLLEWGLIPQWVKDKEHAKIISNQTLNCRSETMFEKKSFRTAAKQNRCLIYIDAFYEHHHLNKKTYPFHISAVDDSPLAIAGLYSEWTDKETGEVIQTASMITCAGNHMMSKIHNNPKADGSRMPAIIPKEIQDSWLDKERFQSEEDVLQLIQPYPDQLLKYYTVNKILGNSALGNIPEAQQEYIYPELEAAFRLD